VHTGLSFWAPRADALRRGLGVTGARGRVTRRVRGSGDITGFPAFPWRKAMRGHKAVGLLQDAAHQDVPCSTRLARFPPREDIPM